jgi:hypothetical protein
MNYKIYLIEDKQKLKYVGSTKETLRRRLQRHRNKKNTNDKFKCSSRYLDLENSTITLLEVVDEDQRNEREQYYIQNINCVNDRRNLTGRNEQTYNKWKNSFGSDNNLQSIDTNLFL